MTGLVMMVEDAPVASLERNLSYQSVELKKFWWSLLCLAF